MTAVVAAVLASASACTDGAARAAAAARSTTPPAGPGLTVADLPPGWAQEPDDVAAASGPRDCSRPAEVVLADTAPGSDRRRSFTGGRAGTLLRERLLTYADPAHATAALDRVAARSVELCEGQDVLAAGGTVHLHLGALPAPEVGDAAVGVHVSGNDLAGFRTASDTLAARRGRTVVVLDLGGPLTDAADLDLPLLTQLLTVSVQRAEG